MLPSQSELDLKFVCAVLALRLYGLKGNKYTLRNAETLNSMENLSLRVAMQLVERSGGTLRFESHHEETATNTGKENGDAESLVAYIVVRTER